MLLPRLVNRAMLELEFIERELIHNVEASIDFVNHFFFFSSLYNSTHYTHNVCVFVVCSYQSGRGGGGGGGDEDLRKMMIKL